MPTKEGKKAIKNFFKGVGRDFPELKSYKPFKGAGPSKEVAKEFVKETPKKSSIFMRGEEREMRRLQPPRRITGARG